jgi:hypothetical protein
MEDTKTGKRIICQVSTYTLEELSGLDGPRSHPGSYPGHMQTFLYFRERIENMASDQYDEGYSRPGI